ncbi:predicted protein [Streptomyces sp. AA4]|nr:predicted protein [Streptomyces sp. AA4]
MTAGGFGGGGGHRATARFAARRRALGRERNRSRRAGDTGAGRRRTASHNRGDSAAGPDVDMRDVAVICPTQTGWPGETGSVKKARGDTRARECWKMPPAPGTVGTTKPFLRGRAKKCGPLGGTRGVRCN